MIYQRVALLVWWTPAFRNPVLLTSERPPKNNSTIDSRTTENIRSGTSLATALLHSTTSCRYYYSIYIYIYIKYHG